MHMVKRVQVLPFITINSVFTHTWTVLSMAIQRGVMVKAMDCGIVVSKFEFPLR